MAKEPLVKAPVKNDTEPRFPVMRPAPFKPITEMRVDAERLRPELVAERVPPLLLKSILVAAVARFGTVKQKPNSIDAAPRPTDFIEELHTECGG